MFDHINTNVVYNMINICHVWHSWHFLSDLLQFSGHSWRLRASSLFVWTTLPVFLDSIVIVCDILLKTRCMFRSSFGRSTNDWNPSGSLPCQFFETFSLFTNAFMRISHRYFSNHQHLLKSMMARASGHLLAGLKIGSCGILSEFLTFEWTFWRNDSALVQYFKQFFFIMLFARWIRIGNWQQLGGLPP